MQERHVTAENWRFLDDVRMRSKLPTVPTLLGHRFLRLTDCGRRVSGGFFFLGTVQNSDQHFYNPRYWARFGFSKQKKLIHSGLRPGRFVSCAVNPSMWQQST